MNSPRTLDSEQIDKMENYMFCLLNKTCPGWRDVRNYGLFCLMLGCGLRVGEVVQLVIGDLIYSGQPVETLVVRKKIAKNHAERSIPVSNFVKKAIELQRAFVWGSGYPMIAELAFYSQKGAGQLTTRQVERIIKKAGKESIGINVHPHRLRHTFGTRLMRKTNARVVQDLLGHKHMSSTQIYTHPNGDDLKKAIEDASINTTAELAKYEIDKSLNRRSNS